MAGPQERVDVLEPGAASLLGGDRDRADHGVGEVAAGGLVDLVLVDVEQRGDDVVGDLRGLDRERPVADRSQRAHPERGPAEVQEPHALAAVRRGHPQADARELGLGVDHDRRGVLVLDVVEVEGQQRGGLAAALAADQQRPVLAVGGVDEHLGVLRSEHRVELLGTRRATGVQTRHATAPSVPAVTLVGFAALNGSI